MTRMLKTASVAAVLLSATTLGAAAQEILLGYLPAGGGPFATFSKTNFVAAEMAVNEINAKGGVNGKKLRIVSFDTAGKPDQAVVGLRKLADDDKVLAIIGPFSSSECRVVFPAAERATVTVMSMASSAPNLAEPYTYAFRNTTDEGYLFTRVMQALKDKKYPTATGSIAYATDDVISKTMGEKVLPALMQKAGTDVKGSVTFQSNAFDLAPQASQLSGQKTDLIGVGSGPEAAQFDAATYDIVLMYAEAMKKAGVTGDPSKLASERTAIRDELRKMKNFPALEGPISFGKNGDALKDVYIIEMQNGKWNLLATFKNEQS